MNRPDLESRIAALRTALEFLTRDCTTWQHDTIVAALAADDAAASAPLPDLPLAEGSRRTMCDEIEEKDGTTVTISHNGPNGEWTLWIQHEGEKASVAWLRNVLALARRAGVV